MTRLAACIALGLLAATPAAATCRSIPDAIAGLKAVFPPRAFVGEVPANLVPVVLAWLESEGVPHRADRIIQVVGDRGLALVLVQGQTACDGGQAVQLIGEKAAELVVLIRLFQDLKGLGREYAA